jgi:hypothetical protein
MVSYECHVLVKQYEQTEAFLDMRVSSDETWMHSIMPERKHRSTDAITEKIPYPDISQKSISLFWNQLEI